MDFKYFETPLPHIIIDDLFNETEVKEMWLELDFLTHTRKLLTPQATASAVEFDATGAPIYKKKNLALFLDSLYANRDISNILHHTRKFYDPELLKKCASQHMIFNYLTTCNFDSTLVSYYEEGDHYDAHYDKCVMTFLTWLYKEPRQFTGGELVLSDYDYPIELRNNRTLIFPAFANHSVNAVKMNEGVPSMAGFGRYVISNFALFR